MFPRQPTNGKGAQSAPVRSGVGALLSSTQSWIVRRVPPTTHQSGGLPQPATPTQAPTSSRGNKKGRDLVVSGLVGRAPRTSLSGGACAQKRLRRSSAVTCHSAASRKPSIQIWAMFLVFSL